jgi:uncharacterized protein (DUF1015 family)
MKILPFQGYRCNLAKIGKLDEVISPPYDQFKGGMTERLYRHPYNMAHAIMNKEMPGDSATNNRYTRSRAILADWLEDKVFLRDPRPSIYPYFQDYEITGFPLRTRKGFVALGEVTNYSAGIVLPHERTLSKPKQDRLQLLRATLADTGLVLMLYSDPKGEIECLLDSLTTRPADMTALDLNHELNRLWKVDEPTAVSEVVRAMSDKSVIIADGHHRYEVALAFRQETAPKIPNEKKLELYGYKLMSFVRLESDGISILPIHRLVHGIAEFEPAAFLTQLARFFLVRELRFTDANKFSTLEVLMKDLSKHRLGGRNAFGLYLPTLRKYALLEFDRERAGEIAWPSDKSFRWRELDVSVLQIVILDHLLGIGDKQLSDQANLEYVSDHVEAIKIVDAKGYQCAFLLNSTPIEQVKQVVEQGDILPQKSTHFHPKLMEGLVFAKHL